MGPARTSPDRDRTCRATILIESTGEHRGASRPRARPTSSSSASTSPTRRRAPSSASTGGRRWRCARRGCRSSTRTRRPRVALELIEDSVAESRGLIGLLEIDGRDGVVGWCPPASGRRTLATVDHDLHEHEGSADGVTTMFEFLTLHRRAVPSASFVFVLSDFIEPTPLETWEWALDRGWDVVPVVIQDPTWEQGFPDVDRLVLPLVGPDGRVRAVRLGKGRVASMAGAARGAAWRSSSPGCARWASSRCSCRGTIVSTSSARSSTGRPSARRPGGTQHDGQARRPHRLSGGPRDPRRPRDPRAVALAER